MRILVAMDSFKGSMTSLEAGNAVREGILRVFSSADVIVRPMADGGEGTVEALSCSCEGEMVTLNVTGPLGDPVDASYYVTDDKTAIMESASACGITLVDSARLDPLKATTFGSGELIRDAISRGCRRFIIGLGGTATNDGGIGMLAALGFRFLDRIGDPVSGGASGLEQLAVIDTDNAMSELKECEFIAATDVDNPMCGLNGASHVFAPQKGASAEDVVRMDEWMARYASLTASVILSADPDIPGSGAAGGLGFAIMAYLGGRCSSGARLIIKETGLEDLIAGSDLVITGEGHIDRQTDMGKAVSVVRDIAGIYGREVIAIGGIVDSGCDAYQIKRYHEDCMMNANARENLALTVSEIMKDRHKSI